MENDPYSLQMPGEVVVIPPRPLAVIADFIHERQTGQLTFHFTNGTLRQIQLNVFETIK